MIVLGDYASGNDNFHFSNTNIIYSRSLIRENRRKLDNFDAVKDPEVVAESPFPTKVESIGMLRMKRRNQI